MKPPMTLSFMTLSSAMTSLERSGVSLMQGADGGSGVSLKATAGSAKRPSFLKDPSSPASLGRLKDPTFVRQLREDTGTKLLELKREKELRGRPTANFGGPPFGDGARFGGPLGREEGDAAPRQGSGGFPFLPESRPSRLRPVPISGMGLGLDMNRILGGGGGGVAVREELKKFPPGSRGSRLRTVFAPEKNPPQYIDPGLDDDPPKNPFPPPKKEELKKKLDELPKLHGELDGLMEIIPLLTSNDLNANEKTTLLKKNTDLILNNLKMGEEEEKTNKILNNLKKEEEGEEEEEEKKEEELKEEKDERKKEEKKSLGRKVVKGLVKGAKAVADLFNLFNGD